MIDDILDNVRTALEQAERRKEKKAAGHRKELSSTGDPKPASSAANPNSNLEHGFVV